MHLLYKEEGKYNFLYNSPQIIAQDLAMILFSFLFESLINYQENFITIKNNLINIDVQIRYRTDYMIVKKRITFYIIILIINLFGCYYISCFCYVYKSTQKYILKDFSYAIAFNLLSCIFYCLIKVSIKFIFIKIEYGKNKGIIFDILKSSYIYFLFEVILEIIVCCKYI